INIFHEWIKDQLLAELLIDVVDYRHVPAGPGVLLVGHEADYSMDNADNRYGLRYNRKAPLEGTNEDRFRQALSSAANACRLLEAHFTGDNQLRFSRREFELFINDRALAPNTRKTRDACEPELKVFLRNVLGHGEFELEYRRDPRARFGAIVRAAKPLELAAL
ncbi:MAG: hypothetical protein ACE5HE_09430, partial [Phycisphaerae bacterium]